MAEHYKPKFSPKEVEWLKTQIYMSKIEEQILDGKLKDKTLVEIGMEIGCDERTVSRHYKKLVEKIKDAL